MRLDEFIEGCINSGGGGGKQPKLPPLPAPADPPVWPLILSRPSEVKLEAGLVSLGIAVVPAVVVLGLAFDNLGLFELDVGVLLVVLFVPRPPPEVVVVLLPPAEVDPASLDWATCCLHLARLFLNQT